MSAVDVIMPFTPAVRTVDLPFPPSVNRLWRSTAGRKNAVYLSPQYKSWKLGADAAAMNQRALRGRRIDTPFEASILLNLESGWGDADNRIKAVMDWAQRVQLIKNDRDCMKLTVEWVLPSQAPLGCRLTIMERAG